MSPLCWSRRSSSRLTRLASGLSPNCCPISPAVPGGWLNHTSSCGWSTTTESFFGIFSGAFSSWLTILIVLAALAAVIVIFLRYLRRPTLSARVVLGCIIGGAIGNLVDRFRLGYVVDFVDVGWWPVFNLADSTINIAMAALVILLLVGKLDRDPGPGELAQ